MEPVEFQDLKPHEKALAKFGDSLFTEFRSDGWPLCPVCGEDELWGDVGAKEHMGLAGDDEALKDLYRSRIVGCYNCSWRREKQAGGDPNPL